MEGKSYNNVMIVLSHGSGYSCIWDGIVMLTYYLMNIIITDH